MFLIWVFGYTLLSAWQDRFVLPTDYFKQLPQDLRLDVSLLNWVNYATIASGSTFYVVVALYCSNFVPTIGWVSNFFMHVGIWSIVAIEVRRPFLDLDCTLHVIYEKAEQTVTIRLS